MSPIPHAQGLMENELKVTALLSVCRVAKKYGCMGTGVPRLLIDTYAAFFFAPQPNANVCDEAKKARLPDEKLYKHVFCKPKSK